MASESENSFARGRRIDRYEIRAPVGEGGMGAVYRAFDTKLGRTVALKTVVERRRTELSEELRGRFMREALAASKVDHRNVVQVLDYGFTEDSTPFIVMEYLRGQDLGARLKQSREPLGVEYVADVMLGVCAALQACHQAGIVHRDLKPANIFLCDTDTGWEVKVLDFGVSKAQLGGDLTEQGQILGTPQYLSPEQVEGKTVPESDQYALGMVLYVCLTKHMPYEEHHSLSLLRAIELGKFKPPRAHRPELPIGLEAIILRALRLAPGERFESVHALGQQLLPFASERGRGQWRDFYLQAPVRRPPESTLGVAVMEELARESPVVAAPPSAGAALASTEPLSSMTTDEAAPPRAGGAGSEAFASTRSAPRQARSPGEESSIDVAGESAERRSGEPADRRRAARRLLIGFVAGVGLVGAIVVVSLRARHVPVAGGAAPSPAAVTVPLPVAPAPVPPVPSAAAPAALPPGTAVLPPPPPKAETEPGVDPSRPAPARTASPKGPETRAHKRGRRDKPRSPTEAAPDGIPIMP